MWFEMNNMKNLKSKQRFRLELEFVGTGFSGWQKQKNARTVQGTLLDVAKEIFNDPQVDIQGHGRTDAGVHARCYTAHIETKFSDMVPANIRSRFNQLLPASIVVLSVDSCDARFHARHNCVGRSYVYQVSKRKSVFDRNFAWWPKCTLNTDKMCEAALLFEGMHDFVAFAEKPELKKSTKVLVNRVVVLENEDMIQIRGIGSHFLWKMVRRIAGVLVEVGKGKISLGQVEALLSGNGKASEFTAPAHGLFFEKAFYDKQEFEGFLAEQG